MAMNMNNTLKTLCKELYETEGLQAVRDLAKQIPAWCKEVADMEKRGAEEEKRLQASSKKLEGMKKQIEKNGKAVIKELRKNATFKQLKIHIAEAEKSQKKAKMEAAKAAKEAAKLAKEADKRMRTQPSKDDLKQAKRWAKLLTKSVNSGEADTKKAITQLRRVLKAKKADDAKLAKEAAKAAKQAEKLAKEAAKAAPKPSKDDEKQAKRWAKLLTKSVKSGEADTKKAITQLRRLVKAKKADDAKVAKAAAKAAKKLEPKVKGKKKAVEEVAVGDDLIATLLSKANATVAEPVEVSPAKEEKPEPELELEKECVGSEEDDEEDVKVVRFEHNGVKYLKDDEGYLYDPETQEEVGYWDGSEIQELEDEE